MRGSDGSDRLGLPGRGGGDEGGGREGDGVQYLRPKNSGARSWLQRPQNEWWASLTRQIYGRTD